jgi:hypothetical protein
VRNGSTDLRGVLTGPFNHHWEADLYFNGIRRLANLPIDMPRLRENADANIQQSGTVTVVWSDEFATSISPQAVSDPLAPFGAQLVLYSVVWVGPFYERVEFGRFEITDVPTARDEQMRFRGEWLTTGSVVELELKELLAGVAAESFDTPSSPSQLSSTWAELARLTGFPLIRTVDDAPISRSVLYPESKLDAVYDLMRIMLDATPHMTASGALSARPNTWSEPVDTLRRGEGLISVVGGMSAAQVYNRVVVRAAGGDPTVLAVAQVTSGPLRVQNTDGSVSPFRARTRYLSSEFVTTTGQAQAWADSELAKVSTLRTRVVTVEETFNPLRERGDVIDIERPTVTLHGRVVTIDRSSRQTQTLTVEVAGQSTRVDPVVPPWHVGDFFPADDVAPLDDEMPGEAIYVDGD